MFYNAQSIVDSVDGAFIFIIGFSVLMLALITAVMIWFAIRYARDRHPDAREIEGSLWVEIVWTVIPTIIVMAMFWYGYKGFVLMRTPPEDSMLVKCTGRMWSWHFEYENGKKSPELVVPLGKPVKVSITSADVLHSLFIPAFRIKEDAVPGMETMLWFSAEKTGEFDLYCTEYCGVAHSSMISKARVLEAAEFDKWLAEGAPGAQGDTSKGRTILEAKGCLGCHSTDGAVIVGPTFKGIWGKKSEVSTDGKKRIVTVDRDYIIKSVLSPNADQVEGFPPIMPALEGGLTEAEYDEVVTYFKALSGAGLDGRKLIEERGCLGCHTLDGTALVGPSLKGLMGSTRTVLSNGKERTVTADAAYIEQSILNPGADVVKGFDDIMPPQAGVMSDEELKAIVKLIDESK